jgi:molybdopterin-containing oxidoreductase family iron-sulfur binding subunit
MSEKMPDPVAIKAQPTLRDGSLESLIDAQLGRGGFLKLVGLGVASAAAATLPAKLVTGFEEKNPKKGQKYRYGMVIDTRRCVGCKACMVACKMENKTPAGVSYTVVVDQAWGERPDDRPLFMTKPCFHCEYPPCTDVCPVGATFKRDQDGIVVVDYDRCIGCRYCIAACPYGARSFDFGENYPFFNSDFSKAPSPEYGQFRERREGASPTGNVRKCTFCLHLQDEEGKYDKKAGRWPSCAKTCTGHAIYFGDFLDPESEVSKLLKERNAVRLKEEMGIRPNVYYLV